MKLLHGTSSKNAEKILKEGLRSPYLTDCLEIAIHYALAQCEADGDTEEVVLEVEVDEANLRYDYPAMDEPVFVEEEVRDRAFEEMSEKYPSWVKNGMLLVPEEAYEYSLKAVRSVRHEGDVPPSKIKIA